MLGFSLVEQAVGSIFHNFMPLRMHLKEVQGLNGIPVMETRADVELDVDLLRTLSHPHRDSWP
jgi:hypothetical protein